MGFNEVVILFIIILSGIMEGFINFQKILSIFIEDIIYSSDNKISVSDTVQYFLISRSGH